jgi:PleD family two-component response regulator
MVRKVQRRMRQRILVVDDDRALVDYLRRHLEAAGFQVEDVADASETWKALHRAVPDLVLLDIDMPSGDGLALLRGIASDRTTAAVPVIVVTARQRSHDRVRALRLGADDYITKPFDVEELAARVRTVLRRTRQLRDLSPLTGLPGNVGITRELAARIKRQGPLAVIHVDIDNFKSFNDTYGFLRGDGVISFCAQCLQEAAERAHAEGAFVGHVGGDDFVVLLDPSDVVGFCEYALQRWDEGIRSRYDPADAERGGVLIADRRGVMNDFPLASISMGVATNEQRQFTSEWEASAVAAEMKEHAKRHAGSTYKVDRRTE